MVGRTFAHYRVIEKLGAGGMGEVYRAHDERLGRDVAIKVLPAGSFTDPAARARLLREARLAAALNHPHICTIHEVGEAGGQVYIVMELIAGQPLQRAIPADGMAVDQVLRYGLQIADAVAHAHARGVIHRDLKTGNIVVTPLGRAKVLDFGLAKRAIGDEPGEETTSSFASLTEGGAAVGTLPYMAPELLRGQAADARGDVWALGVTLYEMAAGARPFQARTALELSSAILHQSPGALPPHVTPDLKAVISRCLEKEPERRYQRAGEVYAALEAIQTGAASPGAIRGPRHRLPHARLLLAATAVLLVLTAGWWGVTRRHPPPPRMDSIAVLPLANFTGDPGQQHFVDATHDGLIAELAQIGALTVISRQSVLRYRETEQALPEIARELNVDALVEGSVFRAGDTVRITVQLLQARPTERHLWAGSFERDLGGILGLQGQVARAIAERVEVAVSPGELARLARNRPVDPAAYQAWLRGWVAFTSPRPSFDRCILHAEEAAALDPGYAPAFVLAAECYYGKGRTAQVPPAVAIPSAKAAAQRAIALDPSLGSAYAVLARILAYYEWQWEAADHAYQRALEFAPSDAVARAYYGDFLAAIGRHNEAIEHARRAELLSPGDPPAGGYSPRQYSALVLILARRYDEAIAQAHRMIELTPNYAFAHQRLALAYDGKGMYNEALTAHEKAVELWLGEDVRLEALLARAYGLAGRRNEASRILAEMLELEQAKYVTPIAMAWIHLGLGQLDKAMDWLDKAYGVRDFDLMYAKTWHGYDPLRSNERFQRLLRRMDFPQ